MRAGVPTALRLQTTPPVSDTSMRVAPSALHLIGSDIKAPHLSQSPQVGANRSVPKPQNSCSMGLQETHREGNHEDALQSCPSVYQRHTRPHSRISLVPPPCFTEIISGQQGFINMGFNTALLSHFLYMTMGRHIVTQSRLQSRC